MTLDCCETLSPHEERIRDRIEGKQDRFRRSHARAFAILDGFEGATPKIDVERALYFTQSFRQTEGQPLVLRWAKALRHIAQNITVRIDEHQLLAAIGGNVGGARWTELGGGPDFGPERVPVHAYLVLGDNRGNSRDGRFFGFVERGRILGRAVSVCARDGHATWNPL